MNNIPFEPQNPLEESLARACMDPAHRPQFYQDFLAAKILVIQDGPAPLEQGSTVLQPGQQLRIQSIEFQGKRCLPIFSSLPRLQAVIRTEMGYLELVARDFLTLTRGAAVMLNPGSPYGKEFTADEIARMLDGTLWQPRQAVTVQQATPVLFGQPARYPAELAAALRRLFGERAGVRRAWLALYDNPAGDEPPHLLVALEVDGDPAIIMGEAGLVASSVPVPDPPVDFTCLTGLGGMESYFKQVPPFYDADKPAA
jgi:hypothetical protein